MMYKYDDEEMSEHEMDYDSEAEHSDDSMLSDYGDYPDRSVTYEPLQEQVLLSSKGRYMNREGGGVESRLEEDDGARVELKPLNTVQANETRNAGNLIKSLCISPRDKGLFSSKSMYTLSSGFGYNFLSYAHPLILNAFAPYYVAFKGACTHKYSKNKRAKSVDVVRLVSRFIFMDTVELKVFFQIMDKYVMQEHRVQQMKEVMNSEEAFTIEDLSIRNERYVMLNCIPVLVKMMKEIKLMDENSAIDAERCMFKRNFKDAKFDSILKRLFKTSLF